MPGVMMSGGRKPVQGGVRVKLPAGRDLGRLAAMTPDEDPATRDLLPTGFLPLPHVKQATGGQVFPEPADRRDQAPGGRATCGASTSTSIFRTT